MKTKCEYCTFDENDKGKEWADYDSLFKTHIVYDRDDDTYYLIAFNEEPAYTANIKHCPMCGRKLSEDN